MKAVAKGAVLWAVVALFAVLAVGLALGSGDKVVRAATITVTSTGDSGPGSLRQAIIDASPGGTINFAVTGTITLTSGQLTITRGLTVQGPGSGDLAISGNNSSRVFSIGGAVVSISGVTISNGTADNGGGIFSAGVLTLNSATVTSNSASGSGGGVYNVAGGFLTLNNSTVRGNTARSSGGGGGVYTWGTLTLTNSTVSGNTATRDGGGIYGTTGSVVTVSDGTISANTAGSGGGGIYTSGTLTLVTTAVGGNTGLSNPGGGIFNNGSLTVTLTNSSVSGNTGRAGGGIWNYAGTLTVTNSTVSNNTVTLDGGGIYSAQQGTITLTNSTLSGNTGARYGGGIFNNGSLTVTSTTISASTVTGDGGGIFNDYGTLTLTNSTVTGNTATAKGGGVYNRSGPTVSLTGTIIAGNTAGSVGPDCVGTHTSLGFNLVREPSGCNFTPAFGDVVSANPLLGPLQHNGGPTPTHALLPGSPAIDAIPVANCNDWEGNPVAVDQRGVARPQGAACDIGAYEFPVNFPPVAFDQTVTTTGDTSVDITLTGSDMDTGDVLSFIIVSLPGRGDLSEGATKITTGDHTLTGDMVTYTAHTGSTGTDGFTFKVSDGTGDSNIATVTVIVTPPIVEGAVVLEGMPNSITGALITFSANPVVVRATSDPQDGSFQVQVFPGTYTVTVEKDGFLPAMRAGLVVDRNMTLAPVKLLGGDVNGDGIIAVNDLVIPAKNLGKMESPWP